MAAPLVLKLGGSTLEHPQLVHRLRELLAICPQPETALVVGGGLAAETVRTWDRVHHLGGAAAHDLALSAMALNERLVATLLPELRLARSQAQCRQAWSERRPALICAACCLKAIEAHGGAPLPRSWDVTSDTIAAYVAQALGAGALVFVKSVDLPDELRGLAPPVALMRAAALGFVDPTVPQHVLKIPRVGWTTLDTKPSNVTWIGAVPHDVPRAGPLPCGTSITACAEVRADSATVP